jgi:mannose-6-phosphate isomerase-like protein (cupin superfamily)
VTESGTLEKISISQEAARLSDPFTMIDLVQIDDLHLSVFLCQGSLAKHRHMDQDELFLVHSGTISLESEWGTVILRPGELAVAPKGVGHRSSSLLNSAVLLLQPRLMVNRRNGDRRLFALKDGGRLEKVSVPAMGRQVAVPFRPVVLAHLDTYALYLMLATETGPWWRTGHQDSLVLCYDGQLTVDLKGSQFSLKTGELVVVPKGVAHRLSSTQRTLVVGVRRHKEPGLPLPD